MSKRMLSPFLGMGLLVSVTAVAAAYPIAGVKPYQRPENAPVIKEVSKNADWYAHALSGVSQPYPGSLHFLESQGAWYTPFNHPGMTGRYDIRGWHRPQ